MSKLKELLVELGKSPKLQDEYETDPEGLMRAYGLAPDEIQAMLDKDVERLEKMSGLDNLKSNGNIHPYDS